MLRPTHEYHVQEDIHLDGSLILHNGENPPAGRYGTRGHTDDKVEQHTQLANYTDMVKVVLTGKEQSAIFTIWYGSFRMRPFVKEPQQRINCEKFGHHARTCRSEFQTRRYCAG